MPSFYWTTTTCMHTNTHTYIYDIYIYIYIYRVREKSLVDTKNLLSCLRYKRDHFKAVSELPWYCFHNITNIRAICYIVKAVFKSKLRYHTVKKNISLPPSIPRTWTRLINRKRNLKWSKTKLKKKTKKHLMLRSWAFQKWAQICCSCPSFKVMEACNLNFLTFSLILGFSHFPFQLVVFCCREIKGATGLGLGGYFWKSFFFSTKSNIVPIEMHLQVSQSSDG